MNSIKFSNEKKVVLPITLPRQKDIPCKVCGVNLILDKRCRCTTVEPSSTGLLGAMGSVKVWYNDAFNCPACGCQNIVGSRQEAVFGNPKLEEENEAWMTDRSIIIKPIEKEYFTLAQAYLGACLPLISHEAAKNIDNLILFDIDKKGYVSLHDIYLIVDAVVRGVSPCVVQYASRVGYTKGTIELRCEYSEIRSFYLEHPTDANAPKLHYTMMFPDLEDITDLVLKNTFGRYYNS